MIGRGKLLWGGLVIASCLGGCTSFFEGDAPLPLYTLKSPSIVVRPVVTSSLAVELPVSDMSLDTSRIAVTPALYRRDYLAEGEWSDRLPQVVQDLLVDAFSQRWGGQYVTRSGVGLQVKHLLQTELQDFSVYNLGCSPYIQIKMLFKIVDFQQRRVLSAHSFCERVPVRGDSSLCTIVEAFNRGMQILLEKAILWREEENPHRKSLAISHDKRRKR